MKKILTALIVITLATSCFVGCGEEKNIDNDNKIVENTDKSINIEDEKDKTEDQDKDEDDDNDDEYKYDDKEYKFVINESTIDNIVLVDEKNIKITATELAFDGWSPELCLSFENNSDKTLTFRVGDETSINGYMFPVWSSVDIPAGKKAIEKVSLSSSEMEILGLQDIADITLNFNIKDEEYDEYLVTKPLQIKTSSFDNYDYTVSTYTNQITNEDIISTLNYKLNYFSEDDIYNGDDLKILSHSLLTNNDGEYALFMEIENTLDIPISLKTRGIYINDLLLTRYNYSSDTISPNKKAVVIVNLNNIIQYEYWNIYGLNNPEKIDITLAATFTDSFEEAIVPKEVTISISENVTDIDNSGTVIYDNNDIKIIKKSVLEDPSDYSNDIIVLLLMENNSSSQIEAYVGYETVSVNGYMSDALSSDQKIASGRSGAFYIVLDESSLEENNIKSVADITDIEMTVRITDDNKDTIDEPIITVTK